MAVQCSPSIILLDVFDGQLLEKPGGIIQGRRINHVNENGNSKWKSTFSPISDNNLTKTTENPLQATSPPNHNALFIYRSMSEDGQNLEYKNPAHIWKTPPLGSTSYDGTSPKPHLANGFSYSGALPANISLHNFNNGATNSHKTLDPPNLTSAVKGKDFIVSEANPFLRKKQLDGLHGMKRDELNQLFTKGKEVAELWMEKGSVQPNGKICRVKETELKNGHNLFISAAPGGLLNGKSIATAVSSSGSSAASIQAHHHFLNKFGTGSQFALGPVPHQGNLGSVANSSVLQSLFSSMPAAASLVHVSSATPRLTNSHGIGNFSSPGITGGTVGGAARLSVMLPPSSLPLLFLPLLFGLDHNVDVCTDCLFLSATCRWEWAQKVEAWCQEVARNSTSIPCDLCKLCKDIVDQLIFH